MVMASLEQAANLYPIPPGLAIDYGTAGFRAEASTLPSTVFRTGVLAALRSRQTGAVTGLVITASHNPEGDNGIKVADPNGGMLLRDWEAAATALANAPTSEALAEAVQQLAVREGIPAQAPSGTVLLARDTRPSGPALAHAATQGIAAVGATVEDRGVLTTPQLHWMVRATNRAEAATEQDYFRTLAAGFRELLLLAGAGRPPLAPLLVDGANGVGAAKVERLGALLADTGLAFRVRNSGQPGEGRLNAGCGADFVQKEQAPPAGVTLDELRAGRGASLDGDADRVVFYHCDEEGGFKLLDGDKIAVLAAGFVNEQLQALGDEGRRWRVGVVQTAYANGAATDYLRNGLQLEVARTATGVKYLHEVAVQFDVGIYFEANGHGTVLLSAALLEWLHQQSKLEGAPERHTAVRRLLALAGTVNQAVGDALSGLLLVEAVLASRRWSTADWDALYTDLPSRQLKVTVHDRSVITTSHAETRAVTPAGLQDAIDACVAGVSQGRAFVRPSGTENVVRVYAEAAMREQAASLANEVARIVHRLAGGLGTSP
ncbi:phosphoacetylglucosamine mutase [Klebsormidium nitens]|uniref:Phosphoacetylglucosamine mutase n=1 Tax=Klebsormidium nitens TaxID=105231 RepID=A0A1Y1IRL6_KLENI|nr:phosphoacetylglucosamine mutase [Klebsormidium nitens]|eukprot:GAQ90768.1 phosphoacetylglucosamine mutase [Klebsormidium nitens]